ncbi:MAG: aminoglycoside phosphotransferase family protein [Congregibacter sp.]
MATVAREDALSAWFAAWSGRPATNLTSVSGDASFRRYFRAASPAFYHSSQRTGSGTETVILCDAPPETEKNHAFDAIARLLTEAGVRVPAIVHADLDQGFFILEDLGDQLLLPLLDEQSADGLYRQALEMLVRISQARSSTFTPPIYDRAALARELSLCPQWFCEGLLDINLDRSSLSMFAGLEKALCERALDQPRVLVHRDFHARNLMVLEDGGLATIDFQDAVYGPLTYDAVSLLRDCYVRWPDLRVRSWALQYREIMISRGIQLPSEDAFLGDFDWMGLQRHIKVLGIFSRLYSRDGKPGYLPDLPRVMGYVQDVLANYPTEAALADCYQWFQDKVLPRAKAARWYGEQD